MDNVFFLVFFLLVPLLLVGSLVYSLWQDRQRREQLMVITGQLGLTFTPKLEQWEQSHGHFSHFALCNQGRHRRIRHYSTKTLINGTSIAIFDYQYVTGHGKNRRTHQMTVFYARQAEMRLPQFRLHPEIPVFHAIAKRFGMQDINFDSHPQFSRTYLLRGENEFLVRWAFPSSVLELFERNPNYVVEAGGQEFLLWQQDRLVPPPQWSAFLQLGQELVQRWSRAA
ncbi:MAG: hypothetical protein OHK0012_11330 [Synechococcales cyanobacterium]